MMTAQQQSLWDQWLQVSIGNAIHKNNKMWEEVIVYVIADLREEWTREIDLVVSHLADERIRGQLRECLQRRRKQLRDDAKKADAKA